MTAYDAWPRKRPTKDVGVPGQYCSFVWARNQRHAERICKERRIGEAVVCQWTKKSKTHPFARPSQQLRLRRKMSEKEKLNFIHSVCFLSFLLARSKGENAYTLIGDEGLLHQAIHCVSTDSPPVKDLKSVLEHFEAQVPGYCVT